MSNKKDVLDVLMPQCPFVMVNATTPGVEAPEFLRSMALVLRLGTDPKVMGMPDLELDDAGFRVTISIKGQLHYVVVPWDAVTRAWTLCGEEVDCMVQWPVVPEAETKQPGLRLV